MVGIAAMPRSRKPSAPPGTLRGCNSYTIRQFPMRPVAQKQSARLISGRPRSVTAPDDQLTFRKPKTERTPMKIAKALKLKNQMAGDIAQLKELLAKQNSRSTKQKL